MSNEFKSDQLFRWAKRMLPDGRIGFLIQMAFTWRLCIGFEDDHFGHDDGWCYHDLSSSLAALAEWDGIGEPSGWHRHPASGRRRPDGDADREFIRL